MASYLRHPPPWVAPSMGGVGCGEGCLQGCVSPKFPVPSHALLVPHFPTPGLKWGFDKGKGGAEKGSEMILRRKLERRNKNGRPLWALTTCLHCSAEYLISINSFDVHSSPMRRHYHYCRHLQRKEWVSSEAGPGPHRQGWSWHLN